MTIQEFINQLRNTYQDITGEFPTTDEYGLPNAVERWVKDLYRLGIDTNEYSKILSGMNIVQYGHKALFHYVGFDVIYGDYTPEDYWTLYDGIYRTCRSTVIDLATGEVLIRPFDKFFNVNELPETSQDIVEDLIASAKVVEISDKLDGSIFCASYNGRDVTYCTSQSLNPDSSWHLSLGISIVTEDIDRLIKDNIGKTVIFEMIHPDDAHVVYYPDTERGLHLIGIRDNATGNLMTYSEVVGTAEKYGVKTTKVFDKTFAEVLSELDEKSSDEAEGFVIRVDDRLFKLKYNDYVFMHKTLSRLTSASMIIDTYRNGHIDDLVAKVPLSYKSQVTDIVKLMDTSKATLLEALKIIKRETDKISDFVDRMRWIQTNVPKTISGYAFVYVKTSQFEYFPANRPMDLKKISSILEASEFILKSF